MAPITPASSQLSWFTIRSRSLSAFTTNYYNVGRNYGDRSGHRL
jgi:hypothetical protein